MKSKNTFNLRLDTFNLKALDAFFNEMLERDDFIVVSEKHGMQISSHALSEYLVDKMDEVKDEKTRMKKHSILDTVLETIKGLHKAGVIDEEEMREFDELCVQEENDEVEGEING